MMLGNSRRCVGRTLLMFVATLVLLASVAGGAQGGGDVNLVLTSVDASRFPEIYVRARVTDADGNVIPNLTAAHFELTEQSELETQPVVQTINVSTVEAYENVAVTLTIDRSGSMSGQPMIDAREAAKIMVDLLAPEDRAAVISFATNVTVDQGFTGDKQALKNAIDGLSAGGWTALYQAIEDSLNELDGETGVRAVLAFTDGKNENQPPYSPDGAIALAQAMGIPVYTIGLGNVDHNVLDQIATETGGMYHYTPDSSKLGEIYEDIAGEMGAQYLLVYRTHNEAEDGTTRTVRVEVTFGGHTASDTISYIAAAPPAISLTQETRDLMDAQQPAGGALTIAAEITSDVGVQEARVFYRTRGDEHYEDVPMSSAGAAIFSAQVPGGAVQDPGVDFYIVASDGTLTSSSPKSRPAREPHQIAVFPNEKPIVTHTPVTLAVPGQDITITASVTEDAPHGPLDEVALYFRPSNEVLYSKEPMISASPFSAIIPGSMVTQAGVDYFIVATDIHGVRGNHGTEEEPHRIVISISEAQISPFYPDDPADSSRVMPGGLVYRYFTLTDNKGTPIEDAHVLLDSAYLHPDDPQIIITDADGVFGVSGRADLMAAPLTCTRVQLIERIEVGGQVLSCDLSSAEFVVEVGSATFSQNWTSMYGISAGVDVGAQVAAGVVSLKGATVGVDGGAAIATTVGYEQSDRGSLLVLERKFSASVGAKLRLAQASILGGFAEVGAQVGATLTPYYLQRFEVPEPTGTGQDAALDVQAAFYWDTLATAGVIVHPLAGPLMQCIVAWFYEEHAIHNYLHEQATGASYEVKGKAGFSLPVDAQNTLSLTLPGGYARVYGAAQNAVSDTELRRSFESEWGLGINLGLGLSWGRADIRERSGIFAGLAAEGIWRARLDAVGPRAPVGAGVDRLVATTELEGTFGAVKAGEHKAFGGEGSGTGAKAVLCEMDVSVPLIQTAMPSELSELVTLGTAAVAATMNPPSFTAGMAALGATAIAEGWNIPVRIGIAERRKTNISLGLELAFIGGFRIGVDLEWMDERAYPAQVWHTHSVAPYLLMVEEYDSPETLPWQTRTAMENSLAANMSSLARRAWDKFAQAMGFIVETVEEAITDAVEFGSAAIKKGRQGVKNGFHMVVDKGAAAIVKVQQGGEKLWEEITGLWPWSAGVDRLTVSSTAVLGHKLSVVTNGFIVEIMDADGHPVDSFLNYVDMSLSYTDDQRRSAGVSISEERFLRIYWWDPVAARWSAVDSTSNPDSNYVTGRILGAGIYVVALEHEDEKPRTHRRLRVYNPVGEGTTTPERGTYFYRRGTVVELVAEPADGWKFSRWKGDVEDPEAAETTVRMNTDQRVTAFFDPVYLLTMAIEGQGSVSPAEGTHTFDEDEVAELEATAAEGWEFSEWAVSHGADVADAGAPETTVTMDQDKTVTAKFTLKQYTIAASAGEDGTIDPSGAVVVDHGTDKTFTIIPDEGYLIDAVEVDGESVSVYDALIFESNTATYTFEDVTDDHSIDAVFRIAMVSEYFEGPAWHLLSVPVFPDDPNPEAVFHSVINNGLPLVLYEWVPGSSYHEPAEVAPGRGYWLWLAEGVEIEVWGRAPTGSHQVELEAAGWHMVSTPRLPVAWSSITFTDGDVTLSLSEAVTARWIEPYGFFSSAEGEYVAIELPGTTAGMDLWKGYWLRTLVPDLALEIPLGEEAYSTPASAVYLSMSAVPGRLRPPAPPSLAALGVEWLTAVVFPNPVTDGGGVTFTVRGPAARWVEAISVRVHDLSGRLLYQGEGDGGSLLWDAMGATGVPVASGVYLSTVQVKLDGEWVSAAVEKLLILR